MANTTALARECVGSVSPIMPTRRKFAHEFIEARAKLNPSGVALVGADRRLTYFELDRAANEIARRLVQRGVGPECVVSIVLPRTIELVVAILGVLKAGAAFSPIEPAWPDERLRFLMSESEAACVITAQGMQERLSTCDADLLLIDGERSPALTSSSGRPDVRVAAENLAYVLFTSGSTGLPKAVGVEHRNLSNYIYSILDVLKPSPDDHFALLTSLAADLGYTGLFASLCSGSSLHVISTETAASLDSLLSTLQEHPVDYIKITPSYLAALLSCDNTNDILPRKCVVLGGEPLRWSLLQRIWKLAPQLGIVNHYGPTETTVGVVTNPVSCASESSSLTVPIGKPIRNVETYLMDSEMNSVPDGTAGELYIGGESVARGYLGRPDLTARQFVPNPTAVVPGARLYRTGDIGVKLAGGDIEFLSRTDDQVKIRGYRVELGEIEAVLATNESVRRAIVLAEGDAPDISLVAYIESRISTNNQEALRDWLRRHLPDHMVPAKVIFIEKLPSLPSGKIDRQSLKGFKTAVPDPVVTTPAGSGLESVEEKVVAIWRRVLKLEHVDSTSNFFDVGGNSLRMIQLQSEVKRHFGKSIPVGVLFAHPTVQALASHLSDTSLKIEDVGVRVAKVRRAAIADIRGRRTAERETVQ
jgi:amino acid adenylation domain-containing protein